MKTKEITEKVQHLHTWKPYDYAVSATWIYKCTSCGKTTK